MDKNISAFLCAISSWTSFAGGWTRFGRLLVRSVLSINEAAFFARYEEFALTAASSYEFGLLKSTQGFE